MTVRDTTDSKPTFDHAVDRLEATFDAGDDGENGGDTVTMSHARALLALLQSDGPLSRRDIATAIDRSLPTVDRILRDFRDRDLVEARPDPEDGRRQVYSAVDP